MKFNNKITKPSPTLSMKSLYCLPELNLQQIESTSSGSGSFSPSKYSLYSARYRKIEETSISSNSPIRLRGDDISPDKNKFCFPSKKSTVKRKGSTGFYTQEVSKEQTKHERYSSDLEDVKMLKSLSERVDSSPLQKLRIIPDGYNSPQKSKFQFGEQQSSPFLKKHHALEQTKLIKQTHRQKQQLKAPNQIKLAVNQLTDTIDRKHPFYNCKLTQSFTDPSFNQNQTLRIEESTIFQRSIMQSFLILSKSQIKGNNYTEMIAIEKQLGLPISLKCIGSSEISEISNELNIYKIMKQNCVHVLKCYTGLLDKSQYIFIREYYELLLRDMLDRFNEDNIKELAVQMLTVFQYFTSIRLVYKGNFFTNVCYHAGLYKMRNFQQCVIKKEMSESSLRRKYLGVLRQMIRVLLLIDSSKPYYSKKLKRDLKPQTIVFMNDLIKNGMGFRQLKEHTFFNGI